MRCSPSSLHARSSARALALCAAFLFWAPHPLHSQADTTRVTVTGTVVDGVTRRPLGGVDVLIRELGLAVRSDPDGRFALVDLRLGTYELTLQREGYEQTTGPLRVLRPGSFVVALTPQGGPADEESSRVSGRVSDQGTGDPVEGVEVVIEGTGMSQISDEEGRFAFQTVAPGPHTLSFSRLGYASREERVVVGPKQVLSLDIRMGVEPIGLAPIAVSVEAKSLALDIAGFYGRRDATSGIFITQEQIEERKPIQVTDLFQGLPGVRVFADGTQKSVFLRLGLQTTTKQQGPCAPLVILDGMTMQASQPGDLDRLVSPWAIAGIEVYGSAAKLPLQFHGPGSGCGVIVIWTR